MTGPLDELYFVWLYSQVADPAVKDPSMSYWRLLKELFDKEFVWVVPNDDNRLEDGKDLRKEFLDDQDLAADPDWIELGCSVLELVVGLSRKLAFEADGEPHYWFWQMMDNLGIGEFNDQERLPKRIIDDVLEQVIWRTYGPDGSGGIFPLREPNKDQRKVELWYQMSAYILELELSS